jgi:hypothetical protein
MTKKDSAAVVEKVQKLVTLAQDDEDSEESRNAAMQVVRMLSENDLVIVPRADAERAERILAGARDLAKRVNEEGQKKLMLGLAVGFFGAKNLNL